MLAFLIYLPTIYYNMPHWLYLLPFFYLVMKNRKLDMVLNKKENTSFIIIIVIISFSLVNFLFGLYKLTSFRELFPYELFYLIAFYIAYKIKNNDLKIMIYFILIEVLFVYLEFAMGIDTIYTSQDGARSNLDYIYLYSFRPHGLSSNSSTMAYKIFLGLLLIDYLKLTQNKLYIIIKVLFLGAVIITFNRTVIVALIVYYFIKNVKHILKYFYIYIPILLLILSFFEPMLYNQFNRGHKSIDLSYRDVIWLDNFNFIKDHILFGNNSHKYYALLPAYGTYEHAHNSFIETLSSNGVIIFILYMLLIIYNIKYINYIYILPILLYSMYQYGVFWGVSFMDIIFLKLLIFTNRKHLNE